MLRISMLAGLALLAAGCGGAGDSASNYRGESMGGVASYAPAPAAPPPPMDMASADGFAREQKFVQQEQDQGGQPGQTEPGQAAPAQLIAYTYNYGFLVPPVKMEGLLNAHKAACESAGPAICYVVNSSISGLGQESSYGNMTLKATPAWVKQFQNGMEDSLKPFEATLDSSNESAEDLTVQIIDGEARLNSMKTMRDRLQELLRDRPGRLSDLLEIEREFARVQADIDSRESVLAAMRLRVAMSTMTLNYQPKYSAASESIWRPLSDAFGNFVPNFASTLAAIVEFIGEMLPVVIFLAVIIWLLVTLVRWVGRRRRRTAAPVAAGTRPAPAPGGGGP